MEVSTLITSVAETANDLRTEHERTLIKVAATTNDLAEKCESIQNRHKRTLTAVSKKAESKLRASDRRHQLELIKMTKVMIAKAESHVLDLDGRGDMLIFTNECLLSSDNLLQRLLFILLGSMEMIAQLRVASVLHLAVVIPMRWLAGNTHKLVEYGWGERSIGRAIALLHDAFVEIQGDGSLLLEEEFVMHIFASLCDELPPFKEYLDYHFEE